MQIGEMKSNSFSKNSLEKGDHCQNLKVENYYERASSNMEKIDNTLNDQGGNNVYKEKKYESEQSVKEQYEGEESVENIVKKQQNGEMIHGQIKKNEKEENSGKEKKNVNLREWMRKVQKRYDKKVKKEKDELERNKENEKEQCNTGNIKYENITKESSNNDKKAGGPDKIKQKEENYNSDSSISDSSFSYKSRPSLGKNISFSSEESNFDSDMDMRIKRYLKIAKGNSKKKERKERERAEKAAKEKERKERERKEREKKEKEKGKERRAKEMEKKGKGRET